MDKYVSCKPREASEKVADVFICSQRRVNVVTHTHKVSIITLVLALIINKSYYVSYIPLAFMLLCN